MPASSPPLRPSSPAPSLTPTASSPARPQRPLSGAPPRSAAADAFAPAAPQPSYQGGRRLSLEPTPTQPVARAPWVSHIKPLIDEVSLQRRISALAESITADYRGKMDVGVVALGVMVGGFPFLWDLTKQIPLAIEVHAVDLKSYGAGRESSGQVEMRLPSTVQVAGKHVLVVEDIVDTGRSMDVLTKVLRTMGAKSIEVATVLTKPSRLKMPIAPKYVGFSVPNLFVVGYGMDDNNRYRNLPFIGSI